MEEAFEENRRVTKQQGFVVDEMEGVNTSLNGSNGGSIARQKGGSIPQKWLLKQRAVSTPVLVPGPVYSQRAPISRLHQVHQVGTEHGETLCRRQR